MDAASRTHGLESQSVGGPAREDRKPSSDLHQGAALGGQTHTIREMLRTLETLTSAGQRLSMRKIVDFVGQHVPRARQRVGHRNQKTLDDLLTWLREESDRALPDVIAFCRRVEDLLVLLTTLA